MLEFQLSIRDLALFLLFAGALVALVYLIIVLKRLAEVLKSTNKIITDNEKSINELLEKAPLIADNTAEITERLSKSAQKAEAVLPHILSNVENITGSVQKSVQTIDTSLSTVGSGITDTVAAVHDSAGDLNSYLNIGLEALGFLAGLFAQPKKKRKKRK
jgi:predicted PurR-regulated permease PerM